MFESLARFFLDLVMPTNLILILLVSAVVFMLIRWYRLSAGFLITALVIILISVTPFLPNRLITGLEDRYPVLHDPSLIAWPAVTGEEAVHIMVLGGGHNPDPWLPATGRLSERALGRLTEGIRLHRLIPESRLIFSGWSSSRGESVAEVMGRAAIELGVDSLRISFLTEPSNTCREARAYLSEFGEGNRLILVTSAIHMPRAVQLFRQNGLDPVPAPTGFVIKFHPDRRYFHMNIDAGNISKLERSIKEYAGMQWGRQACR